jgi:hypothetical protein
VVADSGADSRGAADGAGGGGGGPDLMPGCTATPGCYTVYAHSDHVLYLVNLNDRTLLEVGRFDAPPVTLADGSMAEDIITDLAVAPDNSLWAISATRIYTVSASDGHVTVVGPFAACGEKGVALTFATDGTLYTADYRGALCRIDTTQSPPAVIPVATLSGNKALSGDLVAVADGTMYGTAYDRADGTNQGSLLDNLLVKIDPATAQVTVLGPTGFPKLFGVAYALGQVFAFTHDGTGRVITIDPATGQGIVYGTFTDPTTGRGISFAGAAVNSMVLPTPG